MYRSRLAKKYRSKAQRKRKAWRARKWAKHTKRHQIFSETFKATDLYVNQDAFSPPTFAQSYTAAINSMSQFASYKNLYQKYRILRLDWTIIPRFGQAEPNQAEANIGLGGAFQGNGIIHMVKDWTTNNPPANEIAMLQHQGVKTRLLNGRPIRCSMKYPITAKNAFVSDLSGGSVLADNCKNEWCSFDDPVQYPHGQLYTYSVVSPSATLATMGSTIGQVYCKVTFAVAEPR